MKKQIISIMLLLSSSLFGAVEERRPTFGVAKDIREIGRTVSEIPLILVCGLALGEPLIVALGVSCLVGDIDRVVTKARLITSEGKARSDKGPLNDLYKMHKPIVAGYVCTNDDERAYKHLVHPILKCGRFLNDFTTNFSDFSI
ncbi:MAG: hypothetical protein WA432_00085 [Candidatus Babeliaceae bacterium]